MAISQFEKNCFTSDKIDDHVTTILCHPFDELKQSFPYSEKLVLDSFTSEEVTKNVVLSKIREFPDLNKNDLSTAVIAEFTLNKLLDDVEKTSKHQQDQKKKNSLHKSKD